MFTKAMKNGVHFRLNIMHSFICMNALVRSDINCTKLKPTQNCTQSFDWYENLMQINEIF